MFDEPHPVILPRRASCQSPYAWNAIGMRNPHVESEPGQLQASGCYTTKLVAYSCNHPGLRILSMYLYYTDMFAVWVSRTGSGFSAGWAERAEAAAAEAAAEAWSLAELGQTRTEITCKHPHNVA